jgi:hypothetical protein
METTTNDEHSRQTSQWQWFLTMSVFRWYLHAVEWSIGVESDWFVVDKEIALDLRGQRLLNERRSDEESWRGEEHGDLSLGGWQEDTERETRPGVSKEMTFLAV